jgi:hypothetical protein
MKIICPRLIAFDIQDRAAVRAAFAGAPVMAMSQAWRDAPEERFLPSEVRLGWRDERLLVLGEMTGSMLFTQATKDNQVLCSLGDVFELFLRDAEGESYVEFHIAPNGKRLQLLWPDSESYPQIGKGRLTLEELMVNDSLFDFSLWVEERKWFVCASVPSLALLPPGTTLGGRTWWVSFSRYDYISAEDSPVLSSTSPHAELSFHRQQEWTKVEFR